jgi:hypothetical protein
LIVLVMSVGRKLERMRTDRDSLAHLQRACTGRGGGEEEEVLVEDEQQQQHV